MSEPSVAVFHRATLANRLLTLFSATRPAFLTASVLPVLVAGALAWRETNGHISLVLHGLAILNIMLIHSAANVLNDYFDACSGTDAHNIERIFPFTGGSRFIQNEVLSGQETLRFGLALMLAGGLLGLYMAWVTGPLLLALGFLGAAIGFFYSAPPCLACRGLGDLAVATAFGVLPLIGTELILTGHISPAAWWLGGSIGTFVAAILWVNSIPDIDADRSAGKLTLPARLGARRAALGLPLLFAIGFSLQLAAPLPWCALLALAAVAPAVMASRAAVSGALMPAIPLTLVTQASHSLLLAFALLALC
jgi:1,4-dihydroxy-2-naphthoate octaprenyltransferase